MSTEAEKKKAEESKHAPNRGDFAAGERTSDVDKTGTDFAAGERTSDVDETGTDFAAGQRVKPKDPEAQPDFARGQANPETNQE